MRVVIHDWADPKARIIMKNLRVAASLSSKLVIFDSLAQHTCRDGPSPVPEPLMPNLGIAGAGFFTALDIEVFVHVNSSRVIVY